MLYLRPDWLTRELRTWSDAVPATGQPQFPATLSDDIALVTSIATLFRVLRSEETRVVQQAATDSLLEHLSRHLVWRLRHEGDPRIPPVAQRARDYLHAHLHDDISLDGLAAACGVDRFRLSRAFKA